MGFEYHIPFRFQDANALNQALKDAPHLANYDKQYSMYEYRANIAAGTTTLPDAMAAVREDGFYFCECGDRKVVKDILAFLRSFVEASGQIFSVEDLE